MRRNKPKKKRWGFIYLYSISGKGYVGWTVDLKKRHKEHMKKRNGKLINPYFHRSLHNHFRPGDLHIIESYYGDDKELSVLLQNREIFWIKTLGTFDPKQERGWNLTKGGQGALGRPCKEETKEFLRKKFSGAGHPGFGKPIPKEVIEKRLKTRTYYSGERATFYGKKQTEKWRKRMSGGGNPRARKVLLVSPEGIEYVLPCYYPFCKEHGLDARTMSSVFKGTRKHHKGWTGKYLDIEKCKRKTGKLL